MILLTEPLQNCDRPEQDVRLRDARDVKHRVQPLYDDPGPAFSHVSRITPSASKHAGSSHNGLILAVLE